VRDDTRDIERRGDARYVDHPAPTEGAGTNTAPARGSGYSATGLSVGENARWLDNGRRDRVRWGAIWAGLVTAIATFLLLSTAAVAIGAQVLDVRDTDQAGMAGGIVSAVIALLAFLAGGFVAGRTAGVVGRGYGALNGFLVWGLGVVLIVALAAFGLGSLFGASGDLFAQYQQMGQPRPEGVDRQEVVEGIRNSSIGAFIGMLLPALAAAGGGLLGSREEVVVDG
jgi:hypothetical protein